MSTDEPIGELIRGLAGDVRELATAHLDGMRLEVRQELSDLKDASRHAAIALAVFAIAGVMIAFGIASAIWTYTPIPTWVAYVIVAAICAGAGVASLRTTRSTDVDLVPERELRSTTNDAKWLARRTRDALS